MNRLRLYAVSALLLVSHAASAETFTAEVWADNWFQFRVNGVVVAEDSVPVTTERSFNAERFEFEASPPITIGLIAKDFKENDTGLEYIGTRKQQMGDGGVIAQITDSQGVTVAITNSTWRCLVVHEAPLHKDCEKQANPVAGEGLCEFSEIEQPVGWDLQNFNDSSWANAQVYSESEVRPKDGYDRVNWDEKAELIWGSDLETDNTILCRMEIN